ncbi:hypothetical protein F5Y19DRAFT_479372 [Xylariaceae sp. FL1651]|nr:hypothetical protein F5Y19DRAFT_479372 [Xylariaceae sp. FL1651]
MGDPLSVAGTIAGLVGAAIQLSQVSYQYVASVKGSSKAWSSYIQELSALTAVLLRLQAAAEVKERGSSLTIREPQVSADAVHECISELQQVKTKLDAKLARGGIMGKLDALAWPFSETDTQKKVDMLHRFHIPFLLRAIARSASNDKSGIGLFAPRNRLEKSASRGVLALDQLFCCANIISLGETDQSVASGHMDNVIGVGKTVLSAAISEDLKLSTPTGTIIIYHFFRGGSREDTLTDLLGHLVFQSLNQCVSMIPEAANLHKIHATSSSDPLPKDLTSILTATSKACPAMYILLDGLDEC